MEADSQLQLATLKLAYSVYLIADIVCFLPITVLYDFDRLPVLWLERRRSFSSRRC